LVFPTLLNERPYFKLYASPVEETRKVVVFGEERAFDKDFATSIGDHGLLQWLGAAVLLECKPMADWLNRSAACAVIPMATILAPQRH
jgi:hypothetical protein